MTRIASNEIARFCQHESSAAFELRIMSALSAQGLAVEHAGSYVDPLTEKIRQFDLFTTVSEGLTLGVEPSGLGRHGYIRTFFPIECKQVHQRNPVIVVADGKSGDPMVVNGITATAGFHFEKVHKFHLFEIPQMAGTRFFKDRDSIGIEIIQAQGIEKNGAEIELKKLQNSDLYEKWSQPINSGISRYLKISFPGGENLCFIWICPILVVPDGCLWRAKITGSSFDVSPCDLIEQRISLDDEFHMTGQGKRRVRISNMLLATESGIGELFSNLCKGSDQGA